MSIEIPIVNAQQERIGKLAAFSNSTLDDPLLIEMLCSWRQQYREFFFTQFEETVEKTRSYVQAVLADPTRLMFFIYSGLGSIPVGHLGVTHLNQPTVELDNMIRGREVGDKHLMYWAEIALLRWIFQAYPAVSKALCRLLEDNWRTIRHHSRVGFRMVRTMPLVRREANGVTYLQPYVDGMCSGELIETKLGEMELTKEEFFSALSTLIGKETEPCIK